MKNPFGKTVKVEAPYAVYKSHRLPGWEWRVLQTHQIKANEVKNPYASWFCAVKSPFTYSSWEYGDTYIVDILDTAIAYLASSTPEWNKIYQVKE